MRNPAAFGGWFGVIDLAMTVAMALYAAVGFYGYLKFGDDVQGSITLNLPCHQGSVSLCVCLSASLSACLSNRRRVPCQQGCVSVSAVCLVAVLHLGYVVVVLMGWDGGRQRQSERDGDRSG